TTTAMTDLRLIRIPLASSDPWVSLASVAELCALSKPTAGGSAEDLYAAERAMLATGRLIPLFHLPVSYGASATVKNWALRQDGGWDLADVWLGNEKP